MSRVDFRGCAISGATPRALASFEAALAAFQSWRSGAGTLLEPALSEAPEFVMAHVLQMYLSLSSRDRARVRSARPVLVRAASLTANPREGLHLTAIAAALADDYERAKAILGELLALYPRDVLALQVVHALDYITGDVARMGERIPDLLPAWSKDVPGYHAVLAMQAFALEEGGDYPAAEELALRALALDPFDARAHHVLAHVFEMSGRGAAGVKWMREHAEYWAAGTVVATHCWWHMALFHLAEGDVEAALWLYDHRVRADRSAEVSDLIDASALLWRIDLAGGATAGRWRELASSWSPHIADGFCTFTDLHAMMAFVGARDWLLARRLERELMLRQSLATRHGATTRHIGLPASRALIAFGKGDYARAIGLLARLPELAHRIGGSHAQRDVLNLTLLRAMELVRPVARPAVRWGPRSDWSLRAESCALQ